MFLNVFFPFIFNFIQALHVVEHLDEHVPIAANFIEKFDAVLCRRDNVTVLFREMIHVLHEQSEQSLLSSLNGNDLARLFIGHNDVVLLA